MEPVRQKRSKICITDRVSSRSRASYGGNRLNQRWGNSNLSSESSSCSSCTTEEDLLMFDFGRRSSKQAAVLNGTPMKKLLAKEMLREGEVKRQSPSVIAKLMGLEGLPSHSQKTSGRSQRRHVEDHQLKRKVEKAERSGNVSSHGSSRRSSKDEQEFKDVFEVTEVTKLKSCHLRPEIAEPNMNEAEIKFIRQKFLDAKRLSTDDKLQDSKEFDDTLEVKDLLLKFLQQPDPLFSKHVHDLQGNTFESHWGKIITARKSVIGQDYETPSPDSKSVRENVPRRLGKSLKNCQSSSPSQSRSALNSISHKSTKQESLAAPYMLPTRIVVLKPNFGKGQHNTETIFSPPRQSLFSDFDIPLEFVSARSTETKSAEKNKNYGQAKKSKAVTREISRKARSWNSSFGSVSMASSGPIVYAGDESSSTLSLEEFAYESDRTSSSMNSVDRNKRHENLPSAESSVCKEAKRRLSERWKLAHKSREKGEVSKGSTLAEMLAIPDRLVMSKDSDMVGRQGLNNDFPTSTEPLGISSRDGWKDVGLSKLSRSRSLPGSSTVLRSATSRYPKTSRSRHASCDFGETVPIEMARWEKHRLTKGRINTIDSLATGKLKYPCSERHSPLCKSGYSSDASSDFESTRGLVTTGVKEIDHSQQSPVEQDRVKPLPSGSEASLQQGDSSVCSLDKFLSQEPPILVPENSPVAVHHSLTEPDSSTSSKEADQPSPVSILEAPFTDDFSSGSDCFESLTADLNGLRMQLELLKLESQAYADGSMFIASDEDALKGAMHLSEGSGLHKPAESWEFSYVADVLLASGYEESEPDIFIMRWHSPDCPVGPSVFEELEKTYGDDVSSLSKRKLLFDLINLGIREIYEPIMDPHPWVRPGALMVHPNWRKDTLQDGLMRLVVCREKEAGKEVLDKALANDCRWLNLGDDIDLIGKELGNLLVSELVEELLPV